MASAALARPTVSPNSPKQTSRDWKRQSLTHRDVLAKIGDLIVDRPIEQLSLQAVADLSGVSLWVLRGRFGNIDRVLRAVADAQLHEVARALDYQPGRSGAVIEAISHYAEFVAATLKGDDYRRLLYLVLRNGRHHPWLEAAYEQRVIAKIRRDLENAILAAGHRSGATIVLRKGAAALFHKRIETAVALSALLPPYLEKSPGEVSALLAEIAADTFRATYAFEWQAADAS